MRIFAIDLGSSSIKVVEAEAKGRNVTIVGANMYPLDGDPTADTRVIVLDTLRGIVARTDPSSTRFVVGVPQKYVSVRQKTFPFRERSKVLKSLAFELEDDIPLVQENAIFEARIQSFKKSTSHVLALACPKEDIKKVLQVCHDAGIDPDVISTPGAALENLVCAWDLPPKEIQGGASEFEGGEAQDGGLGHAPGRIILNFGHQSTIFAAFHEGRLLSARSIAVGGMHVIQAIQKKYNLPWPEAEKGLKEKGFVLTNREGVSPDQAMFAETVESVLKELTDSVRRTIIELSTEFEIKFDRVDFTGGLSKLTNLGPWLTQAFELPANELNAFQSVNAEWSGLDDYTRTRMAVALGYVFEGARGPKNPAVNFRKDELSRDSASFQKFWTKWQKTFKVAAVGVVALFIYSTFKLSFTRNLNDVAFEALKKKAQTSGIDKKEARSTSKIRRHITQEKQKIEAQKKLLAYQGIEQALDLLSKASNIAPQKGTGDVDVRRFFLSGSDLTIEGEADSQVQADTFKRRVEGIAIGGKVRIVAPSFSPSGKRAVFAWNLTVNRLPGGSQ